MFGLVLADVRTSGSGMEEWKHNVTGSIPDALRVLVSCKRKSLLKPGMNTNCRGLSTALHTKYAHTMKLVKLELLQALQEVP